MILARAIGLAALLYCVAIPANDGPDLSGIADLAKAQNDYRRMLIEARLAESEIQLNAAKTALTQSETRKNHMKVRHIQMYMEGLRYELDRVMAEQATINRRILQIREQAELCRGLAEGDTASGGFQCLRFFRRHVVPFSLQRAALFKEVSPLAADNFVSNYGNQVKPFPGGNMGKLLMFAERNDYSFAPYETAHMLVMEFLDTVAAEAEKKVQEYQRYMDGIRAGVLPVFSLPYE